MDIETNELSDLGGTLLASPFPCKLRLCVICVTEVVQLEGESVVISTEVFLKGLSILCEKLKLEDNYSTAQLWDMNGGGGENFVKCVCCWKCYQLVNQLVILQELIISTQKSLMETVDKLEGSVIESAKDSSKKDVEFSFSSCIRLRNEILSNFYRRREPLLEVEDHPSDRRTRRKVKVTSKSATTGPARPKRRKRDQTINIENQDAKLSSCFVKLEKVEDDGLLSNLDGEGQDVDDAGADDCDYDDTFHVKQAEDEPEDFYPNPSEVEDDSDGASDADFKPTIERRRSRGKGGKRGRPKKSLPTEKVKRKPGRPAKSKPPGKEVKNIKRGRGRPKKLDDEVVPSEDDLSENDDIPDKDLVGDPKPSPQDTSRTKATTSNDSKPPRKKYKSKSRNTGRPSGRPRKQLFPLTIEQANVLLNDDGSRITPVAVVNQAQGIYSYHNVHMQKQNNNLICKHPDCSFLAGDMAYFSDQIGFRTMKLHIKHFHRLQTHRIYSSTSEEPPPSPVSSVKTNVYFCCHCDAQFPTRNDLVDHVRSSHSQAQPVQTLCEVCGSTMPQTQLKSHLNSHRNSEEKALAKKKSKSRGPIDTSIPLHHPCDECPKVFKNHTELRIHKISHIPLELRKQHQCDICGERLSGHNNLRYHKQRVHFKTEMECPFVCNICSMKFNRLQKSAYEDHLRTHTGERPFVCPHCGKSFHRKKNLFMHEKSHREDNKIQCEFCAQWYKNRAYLKRHHLKHHSDLVEKPKGRTSNREYKNVDYGPDFIGPKMAHPCEPCGRIYRYKSQLVAHMKHGHKLFLPSSGDYPDQNTFEMQQIRDQGQGGGQNSDSGREPPYHHGMLV